MTDKPTDAVTQEDVKKRGDEFFKRYKELVDEVGIDFASYPVFVPDGQGGFKIVVQNTPVDTRNRPVKSDFVVKDKK